VPVETTLHGRARVDEYAWLRNKGSPEVEAHLAAENAHADAVMAPTVPLQEALYAEALGRLQQTDLSVPYAKGGYLYYSRQEEGKQYDVHCRRKGSMDAPEEVVLDVNALAEGKRFTSVGGLEVSDDGALLAYSTDDLGFRDHVLRVRDLRTGADLPVRLERVSSFAWAADGRTLLYAVTDAAKRPHRVLRHVLGRPHAEDALVHEERDERFTLEVSRTRSRAFLLLASRSHTQSEWRALDAARPEAAPRLLLPRAKDLEYDVDHRGELFFLRVNDRGRNFRLVTVPAADPAPARAVELVPHRDAVMLEGVEVFRDFVVRFEREDARQRIVIAHAAGERAVGTPEPLFSVFPGKNEEFAARAYRYTYTSFVTPRSVYEHDVAAGTETLLKREVVKGHDPARYRTFRLHATAPDGTAVPISLVARRDVAADGTAPLLLQGYGAYGLTIPIAFDSSRVSLLDRGVVVALAHVRGGGDLGKAWHDAGRMANKPHTFTDFVAAAEALVAAKVAAPDRVAIEGGSAGGLLVGAVLNRRPDLFRAAVALVPFVDVLNTMLDESLPLTVGEFEEWGNPRIAAEYHAIASYSPYDNVRAVAYPALLVKTAYHDSQVMYWEPAKWVARLRATSTGSAPLLLRVDLEPAGHGGKSGRFDRLREKAFVNAFLLWQLGVEGPGR
jgi:oligopeptidase B